MSDIHWPLYELVREQATPQEFVNEWDFLPLNLQWADDHEIADSEGIDYDLGGLLLLGETSEGAVYASLVDEEDMSPASLNAAPVIMIFPNGDYGVVAPDFVSFTILMTETCGAPYELMGLEDDDEIEATLEEMKEEMGSDAYAFGTAILGELEVEEADIVQLVLDAQAIDVEL
ncbi:MAG: hypothetical protein H6728_12630 [Myxococcales bacterium]|nr:hypothetical protein [Myxococcales bacterium]MCB9643913.1 hypothetical protein [Myxococcales bacterium]